MSAGNFDILNFPDKMEKQILRDAIEEFIESRSYEPLVWTRTDPDKKSHSLIVVAKDWPGIAEAITGAYHSQGFNLNAMYAITFGEEKNMAAIYVKIEDLSPEEIEKLQQEEKDLVESIKVSAKGNLSVRRLLSIGSEKVQLFSRLSKKLRNLVLSGAYDLNEEDLKNILSEEGELFKFIFSRSSEYLTERSVDVLIEMVVHSYIAQKEYLRTKEIQVISHNFTTLKKKENLTGLTIAGPKKVIELDRLLPIIREVSPSIEVKFHKVFLTDEGVNIARLEMSLEGNKFLPDYMVRNISAHIKKNISTLERAFQSFAPGPELYWRIIAPAMAREVATSGITQMVLLPRDYDSVSIVFDMMIATSNFDEKSFPLSQLHRALSEKNILIGAHEIRQFVHDGIPITVMYARITIGLFGPENESEIYTTVVDTLSRFFEKVRDFDAGLRNENLKKLYALKELLGESIPFAIIKNVFYDYNLTLRLYLPEDILAQEIKAAYNLARSYIESPAISSKMIFEKWEDGLYRIIALAKGFEVQEIINKHMKRIKDGEEKEPGGHHSTTLTNILGQTVAIVRFEENAGELAEAVARDMRELLEGNKKIIREENKEVKR